MIARAHPEPLRVLLAETRQTVTIQVEPWKLYKRFFFIPIGGILRAVYILADGTARAVLCRAPKTPQK